MVGVSGRLDPYDAQFAEHLNRFQKNPLYRAIRASRYYTNADGKVTLDARIYKYVKRAANQPSLA